MNLFVLQNLYLDAKKDARYELLQMIRELDDEILHSVLKKNDIQEVFERTVTKSVNSTALEEMTETVFPSLVNFYSTTCVR